LSHAAIARLKTVPQITDNPYIIRGRKAGQPMVNVNMAWKRIRTAAELPDVRIHDLRRTVGSWLVRDGASLHLVGSVLNHKDQKTTAGYAYFQTKERHKALDKHGRNVVGFARESVDQQGPSKPSAKSLACRWQVHSFSREALYELVWSESIRTLAPRLGISDVGLAKACARANIPTPDRGYWARVAVKKDCARKPLPSPELSATVKFRGRAPMENRDQPAA